MIKVLVTGASGFIGSHLVPLLVSRCWVAGTFCSHAISPNGIPMYYMDLRLPHTIAEVLRSFRPKLIIHIAGTKNISACERDPAEAFRVNAIGTREIVREAQRLGIRVMYISTDCVFDGTRHAFSESDTPAPFNVYGRTKLEGEREVLAAARSNVVLRVSLIYGWSLPHQASNTVADVVMALRKHEQIHLPTTLFNTPIYVRHAVTAIKNIAFSRHGGVFHVAGDCRLSRYALGIAVAQVFDLDGSLIIPTETTLGIRPKNSCLKCSRLRRLSFWTHHSLCSDLEEMKSELPAGDPATFFLSSRREL